MQESELKYKDLGARLSLLERKVGYQGSGQEIGEGEKDISIRLRQLEAKLSEKDNEYTGVYDAEEFKDFAKRCNIFLSFSHLK